jgi:hypothetical protein
VSAERGLCGRVQVRLNIHTRLITVGMIRGDCYVCPSEVEGVMEEDCYVCTPCDCCVRVYTLRVYTLV